MSAVIQPPDSETTEFALWRQMRYHEESLKSPFLTPQEVREHSEKLVDIRKGNRMMKTLTSSVTKKQKPK